MDLIALASERLIHRHIDILPISILKCVQVIPKQYLKTLRLFLKKNYILVSTLAPEYRQSIRHLFMIAAQNLGSTVKYLSFKVQQQKSTKRACRDDQSIKLIINIIYLFICYKEIQFKKKRKYIIHKEGPSKAATLKM